MSIAAVPFIAFGGLLYLFFVWRRLREDYTSKQIFSTSFIVMIAMGVGAFLGNFWAVWFWGAVVGFFVGLLVSVWRYNLKYVETLEALTLGSIFWLTVIFGTHAVMAYSFESLFATFFLLGLVFGFYVLEGKYRNFSWYRSGKIGFSGLSVAAVGFLVRALASILGVSMLSFFGKLDGLFSAIVAFYFFFTVYNLAKS